MTQPKLRFETPPSLPAGGPRQGRIETTHGGFETPAFLPVATLATVRGIPPGRLASLDLPGILCNAFHLWLRPGIETIEAAGGLHRFMGWKRPIVTDSGGFQVFSLRERLELRDEGIAFRSPIDGAARFLDPEQAYEIQHRLEADIAMVLDHCPPAAPAPGETEDASERTIRWARRTLEARREEGPAVFAIVQGGTNLALRDQAARALGAMPFEGFAIGGVSVGESPGEILRVVRHTAPRLPVDRPRYLMGVGEPLQILEAIAAGIDFFDCVLPTRNARRGHAFTRGGTVRIRASALRRDPRPLEEDCPCEACRSLSRAYLRHLFLAKEMLGPVLLTMHNLVFFRRLLEGAREAIRRNTFEAYREAFRASYAGGEEASRPERPS